MFFREVLVRSGITQRTRHMQSYRISPCKPKNGEFSGANSQWIVPPILLRIKDRVKRAAAPSWGEGGREGGRKEGEEGKEEEEEEEEKEKEEMSP